MQPTSAYLGKQTQDGKTAYNPEYDRVHEPIPPLDDPSVDRRRCMPNGLDMEPLVARRDIVLMPCMHAVERHYVQWLAEHDTCPECRRHVVYALTLPAPEAPLDMRDLIYESPAHLGAKVATQQKAMRYVAGSVLESVNFMAEMSSNCRTTAAERASLGLLRASLDLDPLFAAAGRRFVQMFAEDGQERVRTFFSDYLQGSWCEALVELEEYALGYEFLDKLPMVRVCALEAYHRMAAIYGVFSDDEGVRGRILELFTTELDGLLGQQTLRRLKSEYDAYGRLTIDIQLGPFRTAAVAWQNAIQPVIDDALYGKEAVDEETAEDVIRRLMRVGIPYLEAICATSGAFLDTLGDVYDPDTLDKLRGVLELPTLRATFEAHIRRKLHFFQGQPNAPTFASLRLDHYHAYNARLQPLRDYESAAQYVRTLPIARAHAVKKFARFMAGHAFTAQVGRDAYVVQARDDFISRVARATDAKVGSNLNIKMAGDTIHSAVDKQLVRARTKYINLCRKHVS